MLHETLFTYGQFNRAGLILAVVVFVIYAIINIVLGVVFDHVVYATPYTNPHYWQTYVSMPILVLFCVMIGQLYKRIKNKAVSTLHAKRALRNDINLDKVIEQ